MRTMMVIPMMIRMTMIKADHYDSDHDAVRLTTFYTYSFDNLPYDKVGIICFKVVNFFLPLLI